MGVEDDSHVVFSQEDHQVAYIFNPDEDEVRGERPSKRRRVSKEAKRTEAPADEAGSLFVPLLNGAEKAECVRLRQQLFEESWARIDGRIQSILRESNRSTLDQVSAFVTAAEMQCARQIPAAFIITGPNLASQDLLFEQLSETLRQSFASKLVRLRSSEAATLKAALKKTIRDATASDAAEEEDGGAHVRPGQDGQRYLDYDLEALEACLEGEKCKHVFVAFQDSEGFESGLISDLITLFHSWRPRIPFTLLFGIATSVELLQARLLKSACRLVYGAQFDCVQTETILEAVFRAAVAADDVPLRLGAPLLRSMLDRQREQIAGIQAFISSLKYAYMCHFYANPLSILLSSDALAGKAMQAEHVEALRNLASFRDHVERAIEAGGKESLAHARALIEDDGYLLSKAGETERRRREWSGKMLRSILVAEAATAGEQGGRAFSEAYLRAAAGAATEQAKLVELIRRKSADELSAFVGRVIELLRDGDDSLRLGGSGEDEEAAELQRGLERQLAEVDGLRAAASSGGFRLQSRYSGKSKVMRTTVIAQRVQLSRDSAALRDEDRRLTEAVDRVGEMLTRQAGRAGGPESVLFWESWLYESRSPLREVLVPRPRGVFERSLARPHDYLGCSCCGGSGSGSNGDPGMRATLPATCILYRLYLETGSLINVADLWSAFQGVVKGQGEEKKRQQQQQQREEAEEEEEERASLVQFYRGLAELRALGFVKGSRKKTDHIAKVKWL
ncbi:hypothetical protein CDD83_6733 [Cordyceps sp. RAO-2017]|nr:hypothetical protein CDD83_6733 [Cordyceps sp. RAO-2017]